MKQIISYILIFIYSGIITAPAIPVIDYIIHYKYISQELCINKDKPELHCNGKCHLKKEIKKVLGDESKSPVQKTTLPFLKLKEYTIYNYNKLLVYYYLTYTFKQQASIFVCKKPQSGFRLKLLKPPPVFI